MDKGLRQAKPLLSQNKSVLLGINKGLRQAKPLLSQAKLLFWGSFLLLIPTQLGKHFWFEWSKVLGMRVDYLVPTVYLIDIAWGVLLIFNLFTKGRFRFTWQPRVFYFFKNYWILIGFGLVNILLAHNLWIAGYRWLRISQWLLTVEMVKSDNLIIRKLLNWIVPIWIIVEVMLGLAQIINEGSLNGIWWWLGERNFTFITMGIAQISIDGEAFLRAYGTFSHPNSLAGFLMVSLLYLLKQIENIDFRKKPIGVKILSWIGFWMGILGVLITGSRAVWTVGLVILFIDLSRMKGRHLTLWLVSGISMAVFMAGLYRLGGWDSESVSKRWKLGVAAKEMIMDYPLFGVGAGNFVAEIPKYWTGRNWLQPVHNIFLLAISEIGGVGVSLFWILFGKPWAWLKTVMKKHWKIILIVVGTGMMDHYWLTLPQNTWLLAVVWGLWGKIGRVEKTNN